MDQQEYNSAAALESKAQSRGDIFIEEALRYCVIGVPVFGGYLINGERPPFKQFPHGYKSATTDQKLIVSLRHEWEKPKTFLAIVTGGLSSIACVDIDKKKGKDGFQFVPNWRSLSPYILQTPSGGAHQFFSRGPRSGDMRSGSLRDKPGVEVWYNGKFSLVPPTPGYAWIGKPIDDLSALPPLPDEFYIPPPRDHNQPPSDSRDGPPPTFEVLQECLRNIPNRPPGDLDDDLDWDDAGDAEGNKVSGYNTILMAIWASTNGSDEGLKLAHEWASKSHDYNAAITEKDWRRITKSPPNRLSYGTLAYLANQHAPGWWERFTDAEERKLIERQSVGYQLDRATPRPKPNGDASEAKARVAVGDFVQVQVNGVDQLTEPARVRVIHERDGRQWVLIEGSETGIPIEDVRVWDAPNAPKANTNANTASSASLRAPGGATRKPPVYPPIPTAAEFIAVERPPSVKLVDPWITDRSMTMVYGMRGCSKTRFMLHCANEMSNGRDFLGWKVPRPLKVLYVDGELPANLLQNWICELSSPHTFLPVSADELLHKYAVQIDLGGKEGRNAFSDQVLDIIRPDVVIYDSAFTLAGIGSLDKEANHMAEFMHWLWVRRDRESSIIVHHENKKGESWGYITKEILLDTVLQMRDATTDESSNKVLELEWKKNRRFWGDDARMRTISTYTMGEQVHWDLNKVESKVEQIKRLHYEEQMAQKDIAAAVGVSKGYVSQVLGRGKSSDRDDRPRFDLAQPKTETDSNSPRSK